MSLLDANPKRCKNSLYREVYRPQVHMILQNFVTTVNRREDKVQGKRGTWQDKAICPKLHGRWVPQRGKTPHLVTPALLDLTAVLQTSVFFSHRSELCCLTLHLQTRQTRRGNTAEVCGTQVLADTRQSVNSSHGRDLTCPYEPEEMLHLNMINLQTSNAQNTGKLNLNTH